MVNYLKIFAAFVAPAQTQCVVPSTSLQGVCDITMFSRAERWKQANQQLKTVVALDRKFNLRMRMW
jgi:hypothetical protein